MTFFLRGDRDRGRQDFEGPTQEEQETWQGKEEKDSADDFCDPSVNVGKESEEIDSRKDPDQDTEHHRKLDGSFEAVPQWVDDDQIPEIQEK